MIDRYPTHWLERLALGKKLNPDEFSDYCRAYLAFGLIPSESVQEGLSEPSDISIKYLQTYL